MIRVQSRIVSVAIAIFTALMSFFVGDVRAGTPSVTVSRASGESPFPAGSCESDLDAPDGHGYEDDATFVVSPQGLVAAWIQDGSPKENGLGIVAARSTDGGITWTRNVPPALSICEDGGNTLRISDPRLVVSGAGTVFLSTVGGFPDPRAPVTISRSSDGGATWSEPKTISLLGAPNQQPTVSADPSDPAAVAIVWAGRAPDATWFARTTDDGATWSVARPIRLTPPGAIGHDSLITLPDGTLVDVTTDNALLSGALDGPDVAGFGLQIHALRSVDGGASWSESTIVNLHTPGSSSDVGFPADPVVGPDGSANLLFPDRDGGTTIWKLFRSRDGASWSQWATVPLRDGAFIPDLAITSDGTVGVLYDVTGGDGATTDVWLTSSRDGSSWTDLHLGGPFDLAAAGSVGGYQELHAIGNDFGAVFPLGPCTGSTATASCPAATDGPTDIFFAEIAPGS